MPASAAVFYGAFERDEAASTASGRLKELARRAAVLGLGWGFSALTLSGASALALATLRVGSSSYLHLVAQSCGKVLLGLQGVEVEVINPELIASRKARVVLFNHSSQLDLLVIASLLPKRSTTVVKKEMLYVPFFGWAFFAFGIPTIDRKNLDKAIASLKRAARIVERRQASVFISPEGTRSRTGKLLPFKKGPFHLASHVDGPIVVMVLRGAKECLPMGKLVARPGRVRVEFVAEIPTDDFGPENIDQKCEEIRQLYLRELGEEDAYSGE